jgi:multidrug resistance efflux pump
MILVLLLAYIAVLFLLVKINIIKLTPFWKLSPLLWIVILLIGVFIPMQFSAPSGFAWVVQPTVQIVPNVAGQVTDVFVTANQRVVKGDKLFQIDARPFKASVDQLNAALTLDKIQLEQQKSLIAKGLGNQAQLNRAEANYLITQAKLDNAVFLLEQTTVRSISDGYVTNVEALQVGSRVVAAPLRQALLLVEENKDIIVAQIPQIYLRKVEIGQNAELTFKMFPNKIFTAKVEYITAGSALGQMSPTGVLPQTVAEQHAPMLIRLKLDDESIAEKLPPGATGSVAIYTETGKPTHIIRKVMIRLESIKNFIVPN